ncbi:MAG TPA: glycosyltransferase [Pyrinomonadaceae bacterium]|nr:glycosyltransferase [Pyrinomonadaceae bacterium]
MNAKRIVLATHGTLGDLHPYLAIASELRARGHQPVIATSEYHRRKVEQTGLAFHALRPDFSFDDKELHWRFIEPKRGLERIIREFILPSLRDSYADLSAAVQKDGGADLLVSQLLIFAAPLLAEKLGVRWVSTELQPGAFMSAYDPPVLAPMPALAILRGLGPTFHRPLFRFARLIGGGWSQPVYQLRKELGLPRGLDPLFEGRNSPHLILALFSLVLAEPQLDWPANTRVTGFPFYDENDLRLSSKLVNFLDHGEAPIVFTLGSSVVWAAGNFYDESIAAARSLGKRALLIVGDDPLNQLREPLPSGVIAVDYAPYAQVFPHASVIVHQGGIGTTAQALRAGKPMIVVPCGGDQYDNAARIERLGVGLTVSRKGYNRSRTAEVLNRLIDNPKYSEQAALAGRRIQAEDGVRAACDAIEGFLVRNI